MKKLFVIVLLFVAILFASCATKQKPKNIAQEAIDTITLINLSRDISLIGTSKENISIINVIAKELNAAYNSKTEEFVWKPNSQEKEEFEFAYQRHFQENELPLYSYIRKIIAYKKSTVIVALGTYSEIHSRQFILNYYFEKTGKYPPKDFYYDDYHELPPILRSDAILGLIIFEKNTLGELYPILSKKIVRNRIEIDQQTVYAHDIKVLKISENKYGILGYYHPKSCEDQSWETLLYYNGTPVLNFTNHAVSMNGYWEWNTKIEADKTTRKIYLRKTGTEYNYTKEKIVPVNETTVYQFDENNGTFKKIGK